MGTDWKLMIRLRERQRALAMEAAARERKALEDSLAELRAAQQRLAGEVAARTALWSATAAALEASACSVETLQQSHAWSGALAARVALAGQEVQRSESQAAQRHVRWDASRQALRAVAAKVQKAEQLQQRFVDGERRLAEQRLDETLAERGCDAWFRPRESEHG